MKLYVCAAVTASVTIVVTLLVILLYNSIFTEVQYDAFRIMNCTLHTCNYEHKLIPNVIYRTWKNSDLTTFQQKAWDFFNRYNKESEEVQTRTNEEIKRFTMKTDNVFNNKFKGFEYEVGDKKFRFNVKNSDTVKDTQSDINNFVKKFLNKNNEMEDDRKLISQFSKKDLLKSNNSHL